MTTIPKFMLPENEHYMSLELGNWSISKDAPQELIDEFNAWQEQYRKAESSGVLL